MKDYHMNDYKTRRKAKLEEMSEEELVKRHSRGIIDVELIWQIAAERLDARAGEQRASTDAMLAAKCTEMEKDAERFHAKSDALACEIANVPVTARNER